MRTVPPPTAALGVVLLVSLPTAAQETTVKPAAAAPAITGLAAADGAYERKTVRVKEGDGEIELGWRLLSPATIEPGRRYPVVLFLHGAGERGDDNTAQLEYLPAWLAEPALRARHPCFVIAPQCRPERRWADAAWADPASSPQAAEPTTEMAGVIAILAEVLSDPSTAAAVDPDRVYLTGLSMGGFGTWDLAARSPERFAAIMPICGGGDERTAPRLARVPVWAAHGDADKAVPVERSRRMIAALKAAGGSPTYVEMPGVGHDSWTPTYRDPAALAWLFGQRRPAER